MVADNIVVFGGAFNPPTIAHYEVAAMAKEKVNASKVLFVPVGDKYSKTSLINSKYRVDMLKIMCSKDGSNIDVDLTEVQCDKNLKTVETLEIIQGKFPESRLFLLVGADNLSYFHTWYRSEEILKRYNLLVIRRDEFNIKAMINENELLSRYKDNIYEINIEEGIHISSSMVRKRVLGRDDNILEFIDSDIYKYIKENKLYEE